MTSVRYVGGGAYLPSRVVKNDKITKAIPGWSPERIEARTGIVERRFLWDFDPETGQALAPPQDSEQWPRGNADMAEAAVRRALDVAGVPPRDLDGLWLVTTTPDEINFCRDAVELHRRLGMRSDAFAVLVDSGCGGAVYIADLARKLLLSGQARTVAIVASLCASPYLNREIFTSKMPGNPKVNAFLSMYMFGDGAGALILRADEGAPGVVASMTGTDHPELVIHRAGGAKLQPARATSADHAFYVDGPIVAKAYPEYMQRAVDGLMNGSRERLMPEIRRFYLHQANKFVLLKFVEQAGLPVERVPMNVHRYGNTSAASTLILFAEDLEQGNVRLGSGDLVLFAAVGAGVHYGGQLVRV
ncbi:MAG TPA: 3-oxoacyl-[acyl-carrier-protein] synthase III C-terminal domain-containing protein [Anaeromyxobacteraceae bacterium]|nr:3-oxoacyl-[acyl-carrier-protein] synthase III C-terminal domain-containing protein [Anaeromyxobacteraceae bacterium]